MDPRRPGPRETGIARRQDHCARASLTQPGAHVHSIGHGLKGLKNTLNYGADRIRCLSPVPAGSRLRGRTTIAEAEDVPPDGLRVNYHLVVEIEGGKRPACVAELIALHLR
jgi:acyl dehydratase